MSKSVALSAVSARFRHGSQSGRLLGSADSGFGYFLQRVGLDHHDAEKGIKALPAAEGPPQQTEPGVPNAWGG
jgi:hypothetical protein